MIDSEGFGLGVVIVDYFKAEAVVKLIDQIKKQELDCSVELCVIDNSMDNANHEILKSIEGIRLIRSASNLGYTQACNFGMRQLRSKYIAFINPDVEIKEPHVLGHLLLELKGDSQKGIVGPRQINPDGRVEQTARGYPTFLGILSKRLPFLRTILQRSYEDYMVSYDSNKSQFVDWIQSSFIVMDLNDFKSIGGFDERYFLFMADVAVSKSLASIDKKTYYCSAVNVYPDGKRASAGGFLSVFSSKVIRIHLVDYFKYLLASGCLK